jgi:hypothetical protein
LQYQRVSRQQWGSPDIGQRARGLGDCIKVIIDVYMMQRHFLFATDPRGQHVLEWFDLGDIDIIHLSNFLSFQFTDSGFDPQDLYRMVTE